MVFAGILDVFQSAQGHIGVDEVGIALHEPIPFVVPGHGDGPGAKPVNGREHLIGITLQDSSESIVSLLDLANDDGLELATRVLEVEIGLERLVVRHFGAMVGVPCADNFLRQSASRPGARPPDEQHTGRPCLR